MTATDFNLLISQLQAAHALQKAGRLEQALAAYDALLTILPNFPDILFLKATALDALARHEEALAAIELAARAKPNDTNCSFHHAKILHALHRDEESISLLILVTQKQPSFQPAWYLLGFIHERVGNYDAAIDAFQTALSLNARDFPSIEGIAWAHYKQGKLKDAISYLEHAAKHDPTNAHWFQLLGVFYTTARDVINAEKSYRQAIAVNPNMFGVYTKLSTLLTNQKRLADAHAVLDAALNIQKEGLPQYYKCLLYFLEGDMQKALPLWSARWHSEGAPITNWPFTPYRGQTLGNQKLLIWGEQGIGDELMFASMFPKFLKANPNCVIVCQERLVPLFARSFACEIQPKNESNYYALCKRTDIAAQCAMGDLLYYSAPQKSYPQRSGYLQADEAKTYKYQQKYAAMGGSLKVGISWFSSNRDSGGIRTISLNDWLPVLRTPDVQFVSVQYGDFKDEVEAFAKVHQVPLLWDDSVDAMKDMDALASQIASLDMVISVANSTVHMAGALGIPVWVMLPEVPSWRWQLTGDDSLWYPHIRLFRQTKAHEWSDTIETIAAALQSKTS